VRPPLIGAFAALAGAVVLALWLLHDHPLLRVDMLSLSQEDVRNYVDALGPWGPLGSMLLMVLHSFLPIPAEIIAVANGLCFGPLGGVAVTWSGAMLGAVAAFAIARFLGRPAVCRLVPAQRRRPLEQWAAGAGTLLMLRLVPVISFNLVNYAAGLAGTRWWTFLWTTAIGILPLTIVTAVLGARMFEVAWPVWAATGLAILAAWAIARRLGGVRPQ
jgi:uncharacterized membrane protein YdjX (TVP38/TMEM64 family)